MGVFVDPACHFRVSSDVSESLRRSLLQGRFTVLLAGNDLLKEGHVRKKIVRDGGVSSEHLFTAAPLLTTALLTFRRRDTAAELPSQSIAHNSW